MIANSVLFLQFHILMKFNSNTFNRADFLVSQFEFQQSFVQNLHNLTAASPRQTEWLGSKVSQTIYIN